MKPEEIIYWNQYSGLTEHCKRSELNKCKKLPIYNEEWETRDIVRELFMNGEHTFEIRSKHKMFFTDPIGYLADKPKMTAAPLIMSCTFKIIEKTEDYVDVHLTEIFEDNPPKSIGFIKFQRCLTEPINGLQGKAAMIIHDVTLMDGGSSLTLDALGKFALRVGLYVLSVMDGDWERMDRKFDRNNASPEYKIRTLTEQLTESNSRVFELQELLDAERNENANQIRRLQAVVREQANQIAVLKKQNQQLKSLVKEETIASLPPMKIDKRDYLAEFKAQLEGKKLCVVGGNAKWQKRFLEDFPDAVTIDNENFDEQKIRTAFMLIVNTNFVGHSCTKKAVELAGQMKIQVCYTSKNNLSNIAKELVDKIRDVE